MHVPRKCLAYRCLGQSMLEDFARGFTPAAEPGFALEVSHGENYKDRVRPPDVRREKYGLLCDLCESFATSAVKPLTAENAKAEPSTRRRPVVGRIHEITCSRTHVSIASRSSRKRPSKK